MTVATAVDFKKSEFTFVPRTYMADLLQISSVA